MSSAIKVEGLSKKYIIGHQQQESYSSLRDVITNGVKNFSRKLVHPLTTTSNGASQEEFWALNDISFEIKQGDRVGIIGRNGAGKSTLLKVLSRITEPTRGRVSIQGRVASLLEVGTGFHPELTGRENIFLNGAILGMSRKEINRKFDEIVSFSEVERFIDTPVKRYSSGMYVRLAFAVAAHLEPEILIIDEVLAVGDVAFQKKCLGKMEEVGNEGRTVLFVSHNLATVRALCEKSVLMDSGSVRYFGDTNTAIKNYLSVANTTDGFGEISWPDSEMPGSDEFGLMKIRTLDEEDECQGEFFASAEVRIEVHYRVKRPISRMRIVMQLLTDDRVVAFSSTDENVRGENQLNPGTYISRCTIPRGLLNRGRYILAIHAGIPGVRVLSEGKEYLSISIVGEEASGSSRADKWPGVVAPRLEWMHARRGE